MIITETNIPGLLLFEPKVFADSRGYFLESFNKKHFLDNGIDIDFVQDNQSLSQKGVVRGLHAQKPPFAQAKLVRVLQGAVLDVAVDVRIGSPTYGRHFSAELSAENHLQLFIPAGFMHGFAVLTDNTIFTYKVSNYYSKESEIGLIWNDPALAIGWGIAEKDAIVSDKDQLLPDWDKFQSPFTYQGL
ncbi:dTDP-4-dehydrorhamnose 3,5-epimerase [Mucilaginibacter litoreus]|uniref:dTDP-4-dehydrorhamnose 3,5-epimerase n=1 Tax=Mucilaginibacter litoreus TaxID=1048221 RepID=A0ABW3AP74_9SPHI